MNNEKHYYITPFLFEEDVKLVVDAIMHTQNYWGDKRIGALDWNDYYQARIEQLERIFNKLDTATFKELPEPPKEI